MGILFWGIFLLVAAIFTVIGVPLVYFLKLDSKWEHSDRSREAWYQ